MIIAAAARLLDSDFDSARGRKPERPRPHVDLGSPSQCKSLYSRPNEACQIRPSQA